MTAINLNKVREARARAAAKTQADSNAVRFGRTKAEKQAEATQNAKALTHLDQHKRDDG